METASQGDSLRDIAYTTPRPDIFGLVPASAISILDVGCSNGALGRSLCAALPGRLVSGIEFDAKFAAEASMHLQHVVQGDLNTLDWPSHFGATQFDLIIFADVLEHLVDPARCLKQALAHLRPAGSVIVSLPNIRHLSSFRSIFIEGRFPRRDRGIFDRTHLRWFTITDTQDLLRSCGLRVSANTPSLRWGDSGGGRFNRLLNGLPMGVKQFCLVREFLTYQICLRAGFEL